MKWRYFIVATIGTVSCRGTLQTNAVKDFTTPNFDEELSIPALTCERGEPTFFSLRPIDPLPDISGMAFPNGVFGGGPIAAHASSAQRNRTLRFDTCADTTTDPVQLELKRVIDIGLASRGGPGIVTVTANAQVSGLVEAVMGGNFNGLLITIPYEQEIRGSAAPRASKRSLQIKGQGEADSGFVVAAILTDNAGVPATDLYGEVLAGKIEVGDPLLSQVCPIGSTEEHSSLTFKTVKADIIFCPTGGTSGTTRYTIAEISIKDSSRDLPAAVRNKTQTIKLKDQPDAVTYDSNHHNVCDTMIVNLPSAQYAFISDAEGFGGGACTTGVAGAPTRPSPDRGGVQYEIRYGSNRPITGNMGAACGHYLLLCPINDSPL